MLMWNYEDDAGVVLNDSIVHLNTYTISLDKRMVFLVYGFLNVLPNHLIVKISYDKSNILKNFLRSFCEYFDVELNGIL